MKFKPFVVFVLTTLVVFGCKQLHKFTQFYMDYNASYTYSAGLPINLPVTLNTPDVTTNAEQQFAINDTRKDLIESILVKQLTLSITSPSGQTFAFLKSVEVYIAASGLPEVRVAHKENIPDNIGAQFDLDLDDVELEEYIKADTFKLRVVSTTDQITTSNIEVNIYSKFFVDAKILGL
jgi:hypothetical protein